MKTFVAAMATMFLTYSEKTVSQVCNPTSGFATRYKFLNLADLKTDLEKFAEEEFKSTERRKKYLRSPEYHAYSAKLQQQSFGYALASNLKAGHGIDAIPAGMDAVDLLKLNAQHGDNFKTVINQMLAEQKTNPPPKSIFREIAEKAGEAMRQRQSPGPEEGVDRARSIEENPEEFFK